MFYCFELKKSKIKNQKSKIKNQKSKNKIQVRITSMSSLSNQAPTNPDLINLSDIFKIVWDRKVLFVLVTLIGVITTLVVATKLPKKITYTLIYKTPVIYNSNNSNNSNNSYLELTQKNHPSISYSCIDDCKFIELSYKVSQSKNVKDNSSYISAKNSFDAFVQDANNMKNKLYGQALKSKNQEAFLLKGEINSIKDSLNSLNSILASSQKSKDYQAENATLKNITDYKIMLLEKESRLKEISSIQPGTKIGDIKTSPAKSKAKLILLAGIILSLIAAFCLVLMLDAISKNKKQLSP